MSDSTSPTINPPQITKRRWYFQISISTFLLLTAVVAVWLSVWINEREQASLKTKLDSFSSLNRELVVLDESKITVVRREPLKYDENIWDVFIPNDELMLKLSTEKITDVSRLPQPPMEPAEYSVPLKRGKHTIQIKEMSFDDHHEVVVSVDETIALSVHKPKQWNPQRGSSGGGSFDSKTEITADKPTTLFNRIFMVPTDEMSSTTPTEPSAGIKLWIAPSSN